MQIPTGISVAIPDGYAGFVLPRSGLALRHGITCMNAPGLIDSGYRGELQVILVNTDPDEPFVVNVGDRIAQLVIMAVPSVRLAPVTVLRTTRSEAAAVSVTRLLATNCSAGIVGPLEACWVGRGGDCGAPCPPG